MRWLVVGVVFCATLATASAQAPQRCHEYHRYYRSVDGSMAVVSAQAFDDPSQFAFVSEIYTDNQPANYAFANETKRMTGDEFLAAFMASKH